MVSRTSNHSDWLFGRKHLLICSTFIYCYEYWKALVHETYKNIANIYIKFRTLKAFCKDYSLFSSSLLPILVQTAFGTFLYYFLSLGSTFNSLIPIILASISTSFCHVFSVYSYSSIIVKSILCTYPAHTNRSFVHIMIFSSPNSLLFLTIYSPSSFHLFLTPMRSCIYVLCVFLNLVTL